MDKFLIEAEKFVKSNSTPQIYHKYIVQKRKLIFGPFSEIIIYFQNENKKLLEEIRARTIEEPPSNLRKLVETNILEIIFRLNNSPIPQNIAMNELNNMLLASIAKEENSKRADIQRYRNNISKYENIIKESKRISIHKQQTITDNRNTLSKKLKTIQNQLTIMTGNLKNMKIENNQFTVKTERLESQLSKNNQELEITKQNYNQIKAKNTELQNYKANLIQELDSVNNKVQKTILLQRFGPGIFAQSKKDKIDEILRLKKEIQQLKQDQAKLHNLKKDKIIKSVKTIPSNEFISAKLARLAV